MSDAATRMRQALQLGRRALGMDEDAYRAFITRHGATARAGGDAPSATTMSVQQLGAALDELRRKGFAPKPGSTRPTRISTTTRRAARRVGNASPDEVALIRHLWRAIGEHPDYAGKPWGEEQLRAWLRRQSVIDDPLRRGFDAPELIPAEVVGRTVERLKRWATRLGVRWQ